MPIYEFYCRHCNTIFSFFSRRINTDGQPICPRCKKARLTREVSVFAAVGKRRGDNEAEGGTTFDEARMEKAMESLAQDASSLDEADPRQAAKLMRKLTDATGMKLGEGMEEAVRRMEAGEDPEAVEAELGDQFENEDPFAPGAGKGKKRKNKLPGRDKKLYEL